MFVGVEIRFNEPFNEGEILAMMSDVWNVHFHKFLNSAYLDSPTGRKNVLISEYVSFGERTIDARD